MRRINDSKWMRSAQTTSDSLLAHGGPAYDFVNPLTADAAAGRMIAKACMRSELLGLRTGHAAFHSQLRANHVSELRLPYLPSSSTVRSTCRAGRAGFRLTFNGHHPLPTAHMPLKHRAGGAGWFQGWGLVVMTLRRTKSLYVIRVMTQNLAT